MPPLSGVVVVAGTTMLPFAIGVAEPNGIPVGATKFPFASAIASPG
jgi:hypothetical protein